MAVSPETRVAAARDLVLDFVYCANGKVYDQPRAECKPRL
jgi:hypothetical protein